jgi:hypothetical protein
MRASMEIHIHTVQNWLDKIKLDTGQKDYLKHDMDHAVILASSIGTERYVRILRVSVSPPKTERNLDLSPQRLRDHDVLLIRLLRNSVPLGERAVTAIVRGGVVAAVVHALKRQNSYYEDGPVEKLSWPSSASAGEAPPTESGLVATLPAACAQLLANLANSGAEGAEEVWAHCFPTTFLTLVTDSSGARLAARYLVDADAPCVRQPCRAQGDTCGGRQPMCLLPPPAQPSKTPDPASSQLTPWRLRPPDPVVWLFPPPGFRVL